MGRKFAALCDCLLQMDMLLDMRLNEQISESEYVSKKHLLLNRKAELKGKLEAFEHNRKNRFEPAIAFISEAKNAAFLMGEQNREKKRYFLKKIGSNLQLAEKRLSVEFKNPWKIVAKFNSARTSTNARKREKTEISGWRREWDSNPRQECGLHYCSNRLILLGFEHA
jgi:hypothetical protein